MKVSVKEAGPCRRIMHVTAGADEVRTDYDRALQSVARVARVPGFRPGKAPEKLVERRYAKPISDEARDHLVSRLYREALTSEGITPVAIVNVGAVEFSKNEGISFDVTLDVAPEFKLPKYKKMSLESQPVTVTDDDVDQSFKRVIAQFAQYQETEDGYAAQDGDVAMVSYTGECEGKPFSDFGPACAGLGSATDRWIMLAEPELIPGFRLGLAGAVKDERRDVTAHFPDDYHIRDVAGKDAVFHVEVKTIRRRTLPAVDAEFLKRFNVDSESALRGRIRDEIRQSKERAEKDRLKDEAAKWLLDKTSVDLPESIVEQETGLMVRSIIRRSVGQGVSREQLQEQRDDILHAARASSMDRVKLSYILSRIAEEEHVTVSPAEVDERIAATAPSQGMTPEKFRAELEKNHRIEALESDIRADKTMDFILEHARTKN